MDILLFHFRGVGGLEDQFWLSKVGVQDYFNDRPLVSRKKCGYTEITNGPTL